MSKPRRLEEFDGVAEFLEYFGRPFENGRVPFAVVHGDVLVKAAQEIFRLRELVGE